MTLPKWLSSLIPARSDVAERPDVQTAAVQTAVDPAFLARSRSWQANFELAARELSDLSRSTEKDFLAIGSNLNAISEGCGAISSKASALVNVEESGSGFDMRKFEQLFNRTIESAGACASAIPAGITEMTALKDKLDEIAGLRSYLDGLSRSITVIGVLTRIETARFDGADFNSMTTVVDDLAQQIARSTEAIASSARDAKATIGDISARMSRSLEAYTKESDLAGEHVKAILSEMSDMNTRSSWACKRIDGRSAQIIPEIGEIVTALQSHDICRQQMEHVAKTMLDAAGKVESMRDAADAEKRALKKWIDDVLRIQVSQLESVIDQTRNAAEGISRHLSRISDLSEAQLEDSSIILEEEESGGLKIEKIMAELESLLSLNARCKTMTTDMLQAVSDTSGRTETMSTHVANIVSISDNISLLATNALIKVAHTGDSGRTLAVLANKIRVLSLQAKDNIKKGAEKIKAILTSSAEFRNSLSEVLHKRLATADKLGEESRATAPQFIAADRAMIAAMGEIAKSTNKLRADIDRVIADIRFDEAIQSGVGATIAKLQTVLKDVEDAIQDVSGAEPHAAQPAELKELTNRYTMEKQREIHETVVAKAGSSRVPAAAGPQSKNNGAAKGGEQKEELDSNIELF